MIVATVFFSFTIVAMYVFPLYALIYSKPQKFSIPSFFLSFLMRKMAAAALQFSIHSRSEGYSLANAAAGARRGTLHFTAKNKSVETPACLAYTVRGSVPHLVADNLKGLPVSMIHVALEHL